MRTHRWDLVFTLLIAVTLIVGCQRREETEVEETGDTAARTEEPMKIAEVQIGRGASNNQISEATDTFGVQDTIYAAVKTENTPAGTQLIARWIHKADGQEHLITEEPHTTAQAGTGWTSFYAANANGWPTGDYELRIVTDGQVRETKSFTVQ